MTHDRNDNATAGDCAFDAGRPSDADITVAADWLDPELDDEIANENRREQHARVAAWLRSLTSSPEPAARHEELRQRVCADTFDKICQRAEYDDRQGSATTFQWIALDLRDTRDALAAAQKSRDYWKGCAQKLFGEALNGTSADHEKLRRLLARLETAEAPSSIADTNTFEAIRDNLKAALKASEEQREQAERERDAVVQRAEVAERERNQSREVALTHFQNKTQVERELKAAESALATAQRGRAEVLEEAAKVCDVNHISMGQRCSAWDEGMRDMAVRCAVAIRALASAPERQPEGREAIPEAIYYNAEHDNFYSFDQRQGQGNGFYISWRDRASEFPTEPTPTDCPKCGRPPPKPGSTNTCRCAPDDQTDEAANIVEMCRDGCDGPYELSAEEAAGNVRTCIALARASLARPVEVSDDTLRVALNEFDRIYLRCGQTNITAALRAALTAAYAVDAPGWCFDMEKAPRDGTRFLAETTWGPNVICWEKTDLFGEIWFAPSGACGGGQAFGQKDLLCWMPLPAPPIPAQEGAK